MPSGGHRKSLGLRGAPERRMSGLRRPGSDLGRSPGGRQDLRDSRGIRRPEIHIQMDKQICIHIGIQIYIYVSIDKCKCKYECK